MVSYTRLKGELLKEIDLYLEDFYQKSVEAGNLMASNNLSMAQIRGFQSLVTSATRFSEIINYIKNQTGKDKKSNWLHVGPFLLDQLKLLEIKANELGNNDEIINKLADKAVAIFDIKLRLARGWAKQVVANCLYSNSQKSGK